jgi:hypothetical protein
VVFHFCQLENIDYLVLKYFNTGVLQYEECSKEWLSKGDILSTSIWKTAAGIGLVWKLSQLWHGQEVESYDKMRRERDFV